MPAFFKDDFTLWLESQGRPPVIYQPGGWMGAPPLGWQLTLGRSTLVYRIPQERPDTLYIVRFERDGSRSGLRSPFTDIVKLISLVKKSGVPVVTIAGHVEALSGRPEDSLESEQIGAFYKKYLAAHRTWTENGLEWVAGDLRTYVPPVSAGRA